MWSSRRYHILFMSKGFIWIEGGINLRFSCQKITVGLYNFFLSFISIMTCGIEFEESCNFQFDELVLSCFS